MDHIEEIKRKLAHLQEPLDLGFRGKEGDYLHYRTEKDEVCFIVIHETTEPLQSPTLSEKQIQQVETDHHVQLPEDYRAFLLEIGNGGYGPGGKMYSLQEALLHVQDYKPSEPFPHTQPWLLPELPSEAELWDIPHLNGVITVAHHGCTIYNHLVVTGPERGHIWAEDIGSDLGLWPITKTGIDPAWLVDKNDFSLPPITFTQWYEGWLDEQIVQHEKSRRWLQSPEAEVQLVTREELEG